MSDEKPEIGGKSPAVLELEPGDYWWCTCGKSSKQPFCDGSHKGTSFTPEKFKLPRKRTTPFAAVNSPAMVPSATGHMQNFNKLGL